MRRSKALIDHQKVGHARSHHPYNAFMASNSDNTRGVVLGSSWRLIGKFVGRGQGNDPSRWPVVSCNYHPQVYSIDALVRRCLLYFDHLEWPINNLMPQGELLHGEYLEARGIIHRTHINSPNVDPLQVKLLESMVRSQVGVSVRPGSVPEFIANAHIEIFRKLEGSAPGQWAFASLGDGMDSPPAFDTTKYRTGLIELFDALPVPRPDVPYDDILKYKSDYRSELLALRARMEATYLAIENNVDKPLARNTEIQKLEEAFNDMRKSLTGAGIKYTLEYCGVEFSVRDLMELGAAAAAVYAGESTVALLIAGASLLKFSPKLRRSQIDVPDGLKYIYTAQKEGITGDICGQDPGRDDDAAGIPSVGVSTAGGSAGGIL